MACLNYGLKGIGNNSCETFLAGVKRVLLGYKDEFDFEVNKDEQKVTSMTGGADSQIYQYDIIEDTGGLTSTLTQGGNKTKYYTHNIALQFNRLEAKKHLEIQAMATEKLFAIVETNDNKNWLVGYDYPISAQDMTAQTGSTFEDLNGYNLTLSTRSAYMPFAIETEKYQSLIANLPTETEG